MAAQKLFNSIGRLGIGLAIAGGVINSMLYNGLFVNIDFIVLKSVFLFS